MSHVADMTWIYVIWLVWLKCTAHICETCLICVLWHDSHVRDMPHVWDMTCIYVISYMCDITYMWYDSSTASALLICVWYAPYLCDMPHMCVTWLTCVSQDSYVCGILHVRDTFACLIGLFWQICVSFVGLFWHCVSMCGIPHVRDMFACLTGLFLKDMRLFCGSVLTLRERVWHSSRARYDLNTCDMTRLPQAQSSCVCDVLRMCVARLTYAWHDSHVRDMSCMCVTWLARAWHASCVRHDLNTYMHVSVHMTHVEYIYALWLHIIHICTMTWIHICMSYGVATIHLVYRKRTAHTVHLFRRCLYVTWLICVWYAPYVCDMSHMCVTWFTCMCWWLMSHMRWWLIRETSYMGYDSQDYI